MRYPNGFVIQVPFLDTAEDGSVSRNHALISSNDNLDYRRVRRILRQWAASHLHRQLHTVEQRHLMRMVRKHKEAMTYYFQHNVEPLNAEANA